MDLYNRLMESGHRRLNKFIIEAVEERLERERKVEIAKGLMTLVDDQEQPEPLVRAQRKAMRHVD